MTDRILIVDDEKDTREFMARALSGKYEVLTAADAELAMKQLDADRSIRLLLSDVRMPGEDGITLMKAAKAMNPGLAVILLTAFGSIDQAVAAMKDGADDFITKPVDLDQLELRIEKALKAHRLESEVKHLKAQLDEKYGMNGIVGNSPAMQKVFRMIRQAAPTDATVLIQGPSGTGKELVARAIEEGISAETILKEGLMAGMDIIGCRFRDGQIFVPQVLIAARAMSIGTGILKPLLADDTAAVAGKVCIGTVRGDLHDIGKNLVKMMLEGKGLEVIDLGVNVEPARFIQAVQEEGCQIICMSALLTTTMPAMEETVKAAEAAGIRDQVKIMVGGAPVTEAYCQKIGADVYTSDAASAADAALELLA